MAQEVISFRQAIDYITELEDLRKDLRSHLENVRFDLLSAIHDDIEDGEVALRLSSVVVGLDEALKKLSEG